MYTLQCVALLFYFECISGSSINALNSKDHYRNRATIPVLFSILISSVPQRVPRLFRGVDEPAILKGPSRQPLNCCQIYNNNISRRKCPEWIEPDSAGRHCWCAKAYCFLSRLDPRCLRGIDKLHIEWDSCLPGSGFTTANQRPDRTMDVPDRTSSFHSEQFLVMESQKTYKESKDNLAKCIMMISWHNLWFRRGSVEWTLCLSETTVTMTNRKSATS